MALQTATQFILITKGEKGAQPGMSEETALLR